mmetsp:Transcript_58455/g.136853  ORF Transcript_58455/g.136853 Transcript_58455/m.136853 type:complete len:250 (+) Transcript_58455:246-995(+)
MAQCSAVRADLVGTTCVEPHNQEAPRLPRCISEVCDTQHLCSRVLARFVYEASESAWRTFHRQKWETQHPKVLWEMALAQGHILFCDPAGIELELCCEIALIALCQQEGSRCVPVQAMHETVVGLPIADDGLPTVGLYPRNQVLRSHQHIRTREDRPARRLHNHTDMTAAPLHVWLPGSWLLLTSNEAAMVLSIQLTSQMPQRCGSTEVEILVKQSQIREGLHQAQDGRSCSMNLISCFSVRRQYQLLH